ncbi:MAG: putative motility protein [Planctomycetota bacterium]
MSGAALSSVANADLASQVSTAVAVKALDQAKSEGEALVAMIRSVGSVRGAVAAAPGAGETGGTIDVSA